MHRTGSIRRPLWRKPLLSSLLSLSLSLPLIFSLAGADVAHADAAGTGPRLNQIQAIGSHNSYHRAAPPAVLKVIGSLKKEWQGAWDYTHAPLPEQLTLGVRQFELDLHADPAGGLFASPLVLKLAAAARVELPPFDPEGVLQQPGFKILHVPDIDCWSNAPTLKCGLASMKAWSDAHPGHLPVMILIECKDESHPLLSTKPLPFTRERLMDLEKEILEVLPADRILRPDDVRQGAPTLREAVLKHGWPEISALRGKFFLALDNEGAVRERYLEGNPALEGRLLFASAPSTDHPAAAWFKMNDPVKDFTAIQERVKAGFLVRTRSDETKPDPEMKEKAFASGAQWISSDRFAAEGDAKVSFEGGTLVRLNPLTGQGSWTIEP